MVKEGLDITLRQHRIRADFSRHHELNPQLPELLFRGLRDLIARRIEEYLKIYTAPDEDTPDDRIPQPHYSEKWSVTHYTTSHRDSVIEINNNDEFVMMLSHPRRPHYTNTTWHFRFANGSGGAYKEKMGTRVPFPTGNRAHYAFYGNTPDSGSVIRPRTDSEFPAQYLKFWRGEWIFRKMLRPRGYYEVNNYRDKINTIIQWAIDDAVEDYKRGVR